MVLLPSPELLGGNAEKHILVATSYVCSGWGCCNFFGTRSWRPLFGLGCRCASFASVTPPCCCTSRSIRRRCAAPAR